MHVVHFDTAVVPPAARLATFRAGSADFIVDPLGDPAAFATGWRMLTLGDVNVIHSHGTAVRFRREPAMIAPDGDHRIAIHYCIAGGEHGTIDGRPVAAAAGGAMVWDLALPCDLTSDTAIELIIVTLPRYLLEEALPGVALAGPIPPGPALTLAAEHGRALIDGAAEIDEALAEFHKRAVCAMFAAAMAPAGHPASIARPARSALLPRIVALIDAALARELTVADIAAQLGVGDGAVAAVTDPLGGLATLTERRRLLAAYRLLRDASETATVSVIAHRCGFRSLPHFSRRFRAVFRVAASDVRRTGRAELPDWVGAYHVDRHYGEMIVS